MKEWFAHSHLVSIENGPSEQSFDHIPSLLGSGIDIFMDRKGASSDVIGDSAKTSTIIGFVSVVGSANLCSSLDDWIQDVDVEVGRNTLQNARGAFESHPGIDVLAWQRS